MLFVHSCQTGIPLVVLSFTFAVANFPPSVRVKSITNNIQSAVNLVLEEKMNQGRREYFAETYIYTDRQTDRARQKQRITRRKVKEYNP